MNNFKIHKDRGVQKSVQEEAKGHETLFYTLFGKHDWLDDEGFPRVNEEGINTYAKSVTGTERTKFFVK